MTTKPDLNQLSHELKDVLARLPMQKASAIDELLPHNWQPVAAGRLRGRCQIQALTVYPLSIYTVRFV